MMELVAEPAEFPFVDECVIFQDGFTPVFTKPKVFMGYRKIQLEPIRTSIKVLIKSDLDSLKFARWFINDLCVSQGYFLLDLKVFGLEKEYLCRTGLDFTEDRANNSIGFDIEIYDNEYANINLDTTKPIITLVGNYITSTSVGEPYVDAGATALDNKDGDITSSIVTVNPVDTSAIGEWTVTYNVTDSSGNVADEVTRIVYVVEAPTLGEELINQSMVNTWSNIPNATYDNLQYSNTRTYNSETYMYIIGIENNAGAYQSITTEIGASYEVTTVLIGADVNQDENFTGNSFVTIDTNTPTLDVGSTLAQSQMVTGGTKVSETFNFTATTTTTYATIRTPLAWSYANCLSVSIKKIL